MTTTKAKPMGLYEDLIAAGIEVDHHESDLYFPANEQTKEILKRHPDIYVGRFTSSHDGSPWYDAAFQYQPYWDSKSKDDNQ